MMWFLILLSPAVLVLSRVPAPAGVSDMAPAPGRPDCTSTCGNVGIPYPFGIGDGCALPGSDKFTITCNHTYDPPRPYYGKMEVINISLEPSEMRVVTPVSYVCSNSPNSNESERISWKVNLTGTPFLISSESNEFTAIGCSTVAILQGRDDRSYSTGCITTCASLERAAHDDDPCTGLGCCQMPSIPTDLNTITVRWAKISSNSAWQYSPCSYAFVGEKGRYEFKRQDLSHAAADKESFLSRAKESRIPMVLDWAIRSSESTSPKISCASAHSYPANATHGDGYLCKCSQGYAGKPYVSGGCTNINECENEKNPCQSGSTCEDKEGTYECKCNLWQRGDGKSDGGCRHIVPAPAVATLATFCAIIALVALLWFIRREHKKRKQRGFFDKNGGEILKGMNINIFTNEELDKITNNYRSPIGNGAFGVVYKGTTDDNKQVAVKRSIVQGQEHCRQEEFVNEITTQLRINHLNLVRLVGCCLETDVPMLVYDFVSNGSLYSVLHGAEKHALSLLNRLDIAIGSAEALSYMHSDGGHNIVHGDIKSGNILLGDNFTPKVSDFGSSKLVSITRSANWSVTGDMNYIDPEYIKTGHFTEKSDVYSFGVVLLELITRKTAKYDGDNSLPINFVKSYEQDGTAREMYDQDISSSAQPQYMECLDRIGGIAVQCLKEDVNERPTMAQVLDELKLAKLRVCKADVFGPFHLKLTTFKKQITKNKK